MVTLRFIAAGNAAVVINVFANQIDATGVLLISESLCLLSLVTFVGKLVFFERTECDNNNKRIKYELFYNFNCLFKILESFCFTLLCSILLARLYHS